MIYCITVAYIHYCTREIVWTEKRRLHENNLFQDLSIPYKIRWCGILSLTLRIRPLNDDKVRISGGTDFQIYGFARYGFPEVRVSGGTGFQRYGFPEVRIVEDTDLRRYGFSEVCISGGADFQRDGFPEVRNFQTDFRRYVIFGQISGCT